jgi:hypothetical protein
MKGNDMAQGCIVVIGSFNTGLIARTERLPPIGKTVIGS